MAYSPRDLRQEIRTAVVVNLAAGNNIVRGWLEHDILSRHPMPTFRGQEFTTLCRKMAVSQAVREVLRQLKLADEDPEGVSGSGQLPLPGFKHLQLGYPLTRCDRKGKPELIIVPITNMTSAERLAKADRYDAMAIGCAEHADELRRYDKDHMAA